MTTLFITGSGTDVGKTFVACGLLRTLPANLRVRCLKPVVTGFDETAARDSDPGRLLAACGLGVDAAAVAAISPWRFRAPLSADMAAAREDRCIVFDELLGFCRSAAGIDVTLVEGIGGVMAPLDERHTVLDWIEALDAVVVLVVGSYLGSLSHSLTAARAIVERRGRIAAIVVSQSEDEPVATDETAAVLRRFLPGTPVLCWPRHDESAAGELVGCVLAALKQA